MPVKVNPVKLSTLPLGSIVVDPNSKYGIGEDNQPIPIQWLIVDKDYALYPKDTVTLFSLNMNIKHILENDSSGEHFFVYQDCAFHKWLNSSEDNWYPDGSKFPPPPYSSEKGFLSNLSKMFLSSIVPTTIKTITFSEDRFTMESDQKRYTSYITETDNVKCFIPSAREVYRRVSGDGSYSIPHYEFNKMTYPDNSLTKSTTSTFRDCHVGHSVYYGASLFIINTIATAGVDTKGIMTNRNKAVITNLRADTIVNGNKNEDGTYTIIGAGDQMPPEAHFQSTDGSEITKYHCDDMMKVNLSYQVDDVNNDKICVYEMFSTTDSAKQLIRSHYPELRKDIQVTIPNHFLAQVSSGGSNGSKLTVILNDGIHDNQIKEIDLYKMTGGGASVVCGKIDTGFKISKITDIELSSPETPDSISDKSKIQIHISQKPFTDAQQANDDQVDISENYRNNTEYTFPNSVGSFYYRIILIRRDMNTDNDLKLTNIEFIVK